jgi:hypothetical protein
MAKKAEKSKAPAGGKKLLSAARKYQNELQAKGLSATVIDRYEIALGGLQHESKGPNPAAQVLMKDIARQAGEFQAAIRKEFPGNASFQAFFKAGEPMPEDARGLLVLGRQVAAEAPNFSANLIRYAINAATVKHLGFLCDQLDKEIGGADPQKEVPELEAQIREAARHAFEGQPQLAEFGE